jgi:hypothetical protein
MGDWADGWSLDASSCDITYEDWPQAGESVLPVAVYDRFKRGDIDR